MSERGDRRAAGGVRERARHRLDILARQLERTGLSDPSVLTEGAPPRRAALRSRAEAAVAGAGLGDVLAEARALFRDWAEGAYNRLPGRPQGDRLELRRADGSGRGPARRLPRGRRRGPRHRRPRGRLRGRPPGAARAVPPDDGDPPRAERPRRGLIQVGPLSRGASRAARRGAGRWWRGSCRASMVRRPSKSVTRPPASSTITSGAARSQAFRPTSTIASAAPSATRA